MMVMNTWIGRLVASVVVIGTAIYLLMRFGPGIPVSSVVTQKQEMFSVSGEGKVTAVPDTGIVSLGITINRPTVKAAQTEVNTKINSITNELKNSGIAPKDIKTENYSVYPEYDYLQGPGRITGYRVTTDIKVTVRQLEKLNEVIDKATAAGANTVSGIQLTVEENRQKSGVRRGYYPWENNQRTGKCSRRSRTLHDVGFCRQGRSGWGKCYGYPAGIHRYLFHRHTVL